MVRGSLVPVIGDPRRRFRRRQLPLLRPASASGGFMTPWKIRIRAPSGMKGAWK